MANWFIESDYLANKAMVDGKTVAEERTAINTAGHTPLQDFTLYGNKANISPNRFFDASEYLSAKAEATHQPLSQVIQGLKGTAWDDYLKNGNFVNPSDSFDNHIYLSAKAAYDRAHGNSNATAAYDGKCIAAEGMTPLTHYLTYGKGEGFVTNESSLSLTPQQSGETLNLLHKDGYQSVTLTSDMSTVVLGSKTIADFKVNKELVDTLDNNDSVYIAIKNFDANTKDTKQIESNTTSIFGTKTDSHTISAHHFEVEKGILRYGKNAANDINVQNINEHNGSFYFNGQELDETHRMMPKNGDIVVIHAQANIGNVTKPSTLVKIAKGDDDGPIIESANAVIAHGNIENLKQQTNIFVVEKGDGKAAVFFWKDELQKYSNTFDSQILYQYPSNYSTNQTGNAYNGEIDVNEVHLIGVVKGLNGDITIDSNSFN